MKELTTNIFLGASIGSLFTIFTNLILEKLKRNRIKKTISKYLIDTILPKLDEIKKETRIVSEAIEKYNSESVSLGMHPTLNSSVMKSFNLVDLQTIYKENFSKLINIIGYLDNLEKRLPHFYFGDYVKKVDQHLEENFERHKTLYSSKTDHFNNCENLISLRSLTSGNLNNVDEIIDQLKNQINSII